MNIAEFMRVVVKYDGGSYETDLNGIAMLGGYHEDIVRSWPPFANQASDISGTKGCLVYQNRDFELAVTPDEFLRFIRLDMTPAEFFAARLRHGDQWMWHDDFYDQDTGEALQPRETNGSE